MLIRKDSNSMQIMSRMPRIALFYSMKDDVSSMWCSKSHMLNKIVLFERYVRNKDPESC